MRTGIYGGSFSPPHTGHIKLAECFLDAMELDRLIIMPAGNPPHKRMDGGADNDARLEMCRTAFLPLSPRIEVSEYELCKTDVCYTVDTLRHFCDGDELYLLCGGDMFLSLDKWRDPQEIFRMATVVCGTRENEAQAVASLKSAAEGYKAKYGARTVIMNFEADEISSTDIRGSLSEGKRPDGITDGVYDVICRRGLYGYRSE